MTRDEMRLREFILVRDNRAHWVGEGCDLIWAGLSEQGNQKIDAE